MPVATGEILIQAESVSVEYLIRFHRSDVTLRETLTQSLDLRRFGRAKVESGGDSGRAPGTEDRHVAIQDVSLTLRAGEVVGFIGRNGSGKTTLLQTLAGVFLPDRGSVATRGEIACLLSLGAGFNGNLTGLENIYLNGAVLGVPRARIDSSLSEVIAFSDLGAFIDAPVRTYSAGMRSRLGFSVAILVNPDVVILDEVIRAGDAAFRAKAGNILDRFRNEQKAVVIASHSMELIEKQCDRVIWLDQGRIRMEGAPEVVVQAYLEDSRLEAGRLGAKV